MIRRETLAVCAIGSRDSRCGRSTSTCVLSRGTKARKLQPGHSSHRSRVFRRTRMTLLSTLLICNGLFHSAFRLLLRGPTRLYECGQFLSCGCADRTAKGSLLRRGCVRFCLDYGDGLE